MSRVRKTNLKHTPSDDEEMNVVVTNKRAKVDEVSDTSSEGSDNKEEDRLARMAAAMKTVIEVSIN